MIALLRGGMIVDERVSGDAMGNSFAFAIDIVVFGHRAFFPFKDDVSFVDEEIEVCRDDGPVEFHKVQFWMSFCRGVSGFGMGRLIVCRDAVFIPSVGLTGEVVGECGGGE